MAGPGQEPSGATGIQPTKTAHAAQPPQPFGQPVDFNLSVPPIEARLVNATALEDYEIWVFTASLVFSAVVGFVVAYVQSTETPGGGDNGYLAMALFLAFLFVLALARVIIVRRRLRRTSQIVPMRAIARGPDPNEAATKRD